MYEVLIAHLRECEKLDPSNNTYKEAANAIEELQATLCNWCAVCPEDKRDLSTCEIYESCRAEPKER